MDTRSAFLTTPEDDCRSRRVTLAGLALLMAPWVAAGAARAAEVPPAAAPASAAERPLDLSLPREPRTRPGAASAPGEGRIDSMPYGSGYESRRLGGTAEPAAAARPATGARHGGGRRGGR